MAELLLEILTEEIPARFQVWAAQTLLEKLQKASAAIGLSVDHLCTYTTPRRLVAHGNFASEVPAYTEERRGPKKEAPQNVHDGFLNSLPANAVIETRDTLKGAYIFAIITHPARATRTLLPTLLSNILCSFSWPKTMRWGISSFSWVRPIRNIMCLFDREVLDFSFQGLQATNSTVGHRFLAPERFPVTNFSHYIDALIQRYVFLDRQKRADALQTQLREIEAHHSIEIVQDNALFEEVLGLTEWPVALSGRVDKPYMDLPEELIITPMKVHQRYFSTRYRDGTLAPFFVCIAGTQTQDKGKTIIAGNEAVLRARLADARFFFETDKKVPLDKRTEELALQIFHRRLGTIAERLPRLQTWSTLLYTTLQDMPLFKEVSMPLLTRAIYLCKADLRTEAVKEFPELQGIMGGYYAALQGEPSVVATAIKEHYRPQGPDDAVPTTPLGILLALADKLETIWSFFGINERPSGSKDPFALRRAALGVIRLVLAHRLLLDLVSLFEGYRQTTLLSFEIADAVLSFFKERLKIQLKESGISSGVVAALLKQDTVDIGRITGRAQLLNQFLQTPAGNDLLQGYRRLSNILSTASDGDSTIPIVQDLLIEKAEVSLYQAVQAANKAASVLEETHEDFQKRLTLLAALRTPINTFFEEILVHCEEKQIRRNRCALLMYIKAFYDHVCAFEEIVS
ncbi:MAG: glycine--tRNA ligase subunit beta [Holosporales bacterium]|jgi:glycyl-tRNA synthetase beta chain|nr:glycine--tRNA ligase subunit beta [Holosporales bacterium]